MSFTPANVLLDYQSKLNWAEIPLVVNDPTPDSIIVIFVMNNGIPFGGGRLLNLAGDFFRIPRLIYPPFISLIGTKANNQKAYIALNVDLNNAVVVEITAVDESGGGSGTPSGDYRVAGTMKVKGVATQRDLIVVSDDPSGRQIVGEGESETDGTFDLTYTGWDGAVIVVALDYYGVAFSAVTPLNVGNVVHPTIANGYVYVVTDAGTTGASEPAWSTSGSVVSGSVTFAPRPYYRPVGSGPLKGELVE